MYLFVLRSAAASLSLAFQLSPALHHISLMRVCRVVGAVRSEETRRRADLLPEFDGSSCFRYVSQLNSFSNTKSHSPNLSACVHKQIYETKACARSDLQNINFALIYTITTCASCGSWNWTCNFIRAVRISKRLPHNWTVSVCLLVVGLRELLRFAQNLFGGGK